jgi:hypothetical protein
MVDSLVKFSVLDDVALRDGRDSVGSIERDRPDSKNAGGAGISSVISGLGPLLRCRRARVAWNLDQLQIHR